MGSALITNDYWFDAQGNTNNIMPRPDGWELLRWIRAQRAFADLHVVILSGMDLNGESRRALEKGADACWEKPFPFSGLVRMVEQFRDR